MIQAADFVREGRLPDIEYRTDAPEEVVCPRVAHRGGVAMVYLHNERDASHQGFVPVATFLQRLARLEPGGCDVYLPQLREAAHPAVRTARRMGEGVLVNLLSKLAGA